LSIDVNRLKELVSKEDTIKKLREVFRREETLRAVKGILSGALGVALAYIPFSIPCLLLAQVTAEIFPEEFVERVKRVLKAPKEEDLLKEIKGEIEKNGELRKILIDLLKEVLEEKKGLENLSSEDVNRMTNALSEAAKVFPELEKRILAVERELEDLRKTVEDHERRIRELERLKKVVPIRSADDLHEELRIPKRNIVLSSSLREKVNEVVELVTKAVENKEKLKVAVLGEAGIGKTTFLCLVVKSLLGRDLRVYTGWPEEKEGVYIVDDLPKQGKVLKEEVARWSGVVIATGRTSEWRADNSLKGWKEVIIEREDHESAAHDMLISMLNERNVKYSEDAVDLIIRRAPPLPFYFSELANMLSGKELTVDVAEKVPPEVYELVADEISYVADDELAIAVLYFLSCTKTGCLHSDQIRILKKMLEDDFEGEGRCESLLIKLDDSWGLRHEIWRDVLTKSWEELGIHKEEPPVLSTLRLESNVESTVKEACRRSLDLLDRRRDHSAAEIVIRILDNFPDMGVEVAKRAMSLEGYKKWLVLDMVASRSPERYLSDLAKALNTVGNVLSEKGRFDYAIKHHKEALEICIKQAQLAQEDKRYLSDLALTLNNLAEGFFEKGMLDNAIMYLEEALEIRRKLAQEDERYLPDLAMVLNNLGEVLYEKGMLDNAIMYLEEAKDLLTSVIDRYPQHALLLSQSHLLLGRSFLVRKEKEKAIRNLCLALDLLLKAPDSLYKYKMSSEVLRILESIKPDLPLDCRRKLDLLKQ